MNTITEAGPIMPESEPAPTVTMQSRVTYYLIAAMIVATALAVASIAVDTIRKVPPPAAPPAETAIEVGHSYYRVTDVVVPPVNPFKTEATKPVSLNIAVVTDIKRDWVQYNLCSFDVKNASLIETTGLSLSLWSFENLYRPLAYDTNSTILWK